MDRIIRELYRGNYEVFDHKYRYNAEHKKTLDDVERLETELVRFLPDEGKALFREYSNACGMLSCITCEDVFLEGYRLGVRIILAAFSDIDADGIMPE